MARKVETEFWNSVECDGCQTPKPELEVIDFAAEGAAGKGDKHMEMYECPNCGLQGAMSFTPPTNMYTLKGPLFGETEDVQTLQDEISNLS